MQLFGLVESLNTFLADLPFYLRPAHKLGITSGNFIIYMWMLKKNVRFFAKHLCSSNFYAVMGMAVSEYFLMGTIVFFRLKRSCSFGSMNWFNLRAAFVFFLFYSSSVLLSGILKFCMQNWLNMFSFIFE